MMRWRKGMTAMRLTTAIIVSISRTPPSPHSLALKTKATTAPTWRSRALMCGCSTSPPIAAATTTTARITFMAMHLTAKEPFMMRVAQRVASSGDEESHDDEGGDDSQSAAEGDGDETQPSTKKTKSVKKRINRKLYRHRIAEEFIEKAASFKDGDYIGKSLVAGGKVTVMAPARVASTVRPPGVNADQIIVASTAADLIQTA